jgi:hypothetical protein
MTTAPSRNARVAVFSIGSVLASSIRQDTSATRRPVASRHVHPVSFSRAPVRYVPRPLGWDVPQGGPDRDGMDACTGTLVNYSNTPCEMIEADQPIVIERYAFVPNTGGAGRYRGGLSIERHLRFRTSNATLQIRSDRRDHPPYGLRGGRPGGSSDVRIRRADGVPHGCGRGRGLRAARRGAAPTCEGAALPAMTRRVTHGTMR